MPPNWDMNSCNEKAGFLFAHDCSRPTAGNCSRCLKPICNDHSHHRMGVIMCTSCARVDEQQRHSTDDDDYYRDDPYFYGGYNYGHHYRDTYGHSRRNDPHDFTEADGESLRGEGDEHFESDMSES
jgi:hypothetical protein